MLTHLADNTHLCTPKLVIFPSDAILNGQHIREFGYAKLWIVRTMILNGKLRMQKRGLSYFILLYRHECFTGKYTTRKIHKNYIRDPTDLFSIISHVSLSMT